MTKSTLLTNIKDTVIKIYLMDSLTHNGPKSKKRNVVHKAKSRIVKNTKSPIYDFMLTFSNYKKSQVIYVSCVIILVSIWIQI